MKKLLVFLGNPGSRYGGTRHNYGFILCDETNKGKAWAQKFNALWCRDGETVLLKPQTFMNESGLSVRQCSDFFKIGAEDILVCHDDCELPFGECLIQKGGPVRGHNGLRSVAQHLGTDSFYRLRLGIGRPAAAQDLASFVLSGFDSIEKAQLCDCILKAEKLIKGFTEK